MTYETGSTVQTTIALIINLVCLKSLFTRRDVRVVLFSTLFCSAVLIPTIIFLHYYELINYKSFFPRSRNSTSGITTASQDDVALTQHNFRFVNRFISSYDRNVDERLTGLIDEKATGSHPGLVQLVRDLLDPPATRGTIKIGPGEIEFTPQIAQVEYLLRHKVGGFFVEAGALDGERASNSLFLEVHRNWSGLLVEMDPFFYTQLLGKNRKAWSINACLNPHSFVTQMEFIPSSSWSGKLRRGPNSSLPADTNHLAPCFSLETLLAAVNRTKVDYFSLDVEGVEVEVLKTIPFDKIDITILSVEHQFINKTEAKQLMEDHGYFLYRDTYMRRRGKIAATLDLIFVKNSSVNPNRIKPLVSDIE